VLYEKRGIALDDGERVVAAVTLPARTFDRDRTVHTAVTPSETKTAD